MANLKDNIIFNGVKHLPTIYKEGAVISYNLVKEFCCGRAATKLDQTIYEAEDSVKNILQYMGSYFASIPQKKSSVSCAFNQILYNCNLSDSYEKSYVLQVPIEILSKLCGTDDECQMSVILNKLKNTKISRLEGNRVFDFYPILNYKLVGEERSFLLYPSATAYSFFTNQEIVPEVKKEVKNCGGRPKTDLSGVIKLLKNKKGEEFVVTVTELRMSLNSKNKYASNSDFIRVKFEPLCKELGVEIEDRITEGKKVVALRLKRV